MWTHSTLRKRSIVFILTLFMFYMFISAGFQQNHYEFFIKITPYSNDAKHGDDLYLIKPSTFRLNKLFDILQFKERTYQDLDDKLKLISFNELIQYKNKNYSGDHLVNLYKEEIGLFLKISQRRNQKEFTHELQASSEFIDYLLNKSNKHTFNNPRTKISPSNISALVSFYVKFSEA